MCLPLSYSFTSPVVVFYSAKLYTDRRDVLHSFGVTHSGTNINVEFCYI